MKQHSLAALSLITVLAGCGGADPAPNRGNCDAQRQAYAEKYGPPEQITRGEGDRNYSVTYLYHSQGFGRTFHWGESYLNCMTSDITMEPYALAQPR